MKKQTQVITERKSPAPVNIKLQKEVRNFIAANKKLIERLRNV